MSEDPDEPRARVKARIEYHSEPADDPVVVGLLVVLIGLLSAVFIALVVML